jgi:hypothetical protein
VSTTEQHISYLYISRKPITQSVTLSEEHKYRMFEKRMLRIFGPKGEKATESWRRLHHEELHNLYPLQNVIRVTNSRRMRWARYVTLMAEMRNAYKVLNRRPEGKRQLGRPRNKWKNIKADLR